MRRRHWQRPTHQCEPLSGCQWIRTTSSAAGWMLPVALLTGSESESDCLARTPSSWPLSGSASASRVGISLRDAVPLPPRPESELPSRALNSTATASPLDVYSKQWQFTSSTASGRLRGLLLQADRVAAAAAGGFRRPFTEFQVHSTKLLHAHASDSGT